MKDNKIVKNWNDKSYKAAGFSAQRIYPNEELCRFIGRNFSDISLDERKDIKVLEVGCGSCANLWMIAREGFDTYGCDISLESIKLGKEMLKNQRTTANISVQDMCKTQYAEESFDVIVDIFSSCCMDKNGYSVFVNEIKRLLKPRGIFFSYFPSQNSDAYMNHGPALMIDEDTLEGIKRETSPYFGNDYAFRFMNEQGVGRFWGRQNINYFEIVGRTYRNTKEYFEWLTFEYVK